MTGCSAMNSAADAEGRNVEMFTPTVTSDGEEFVLSRPAHLEDLLESRG